MALPGVLVGERRGPFPGRLDPDLVRRVAVRFASPTFLGDELHVQVYRAGELAYPFEAEAGGAAVIRNGLVELRA
jgi:hypothetical protein